VIRQPACACVWYADMVAVCSTYLRGQNIPVDETTRHEQEEKRRKYLEHQARHDVCILRPLVPLFCMRRAASANTEFSCYILQLSSTEILSLPYRVVTTTQLAYLYNLMIYLSVAPSFFRSDNHLLPTFLFLSEGQQLLFPSHITLSLE